MKRPAGADWRTLMLLAVSATAICAMALLPPIRQDPGYHLFADRRTWLGIPNFANVVSNLGFVLVGLLGLAGLRGPNPTRAIVSSLLPAYRTFFVGFALIGAGSAYYHLAPTNASLVWDRIPMSVSFMAFVAIIVGEHMNERFALRLLPALIALGVGSVMYWYAMELRGAGDLRLYGLVQFLPMVLVPLILLTFPSVFNGVGYLWGMLAAYVLAKLAEMGDDGLYRMLGFSGHTLKHLIAAAAGWIFWQGLRHRQRAGTSPHRTG
ncbi:MAG: ceramidase domain-containing protein [Methylotetracoccus sp.]